MADHFKIRQSFFVMSRTSRTLFIAAGSLVVVWLLGWAGFAIAQHFKMDADKVMRFANSVDLAKLGAADRAEALRALEDKVNGLSIEERRKWWKEGSWRHWFDNMSETEKGQYIEATLPTGFKQMLSAFEELPEPKRKTIIDDMIKKLKEEHRMQTDREPGQDASAGGTNQPVVLSAELENRARTIGLKTFYAESSAETKAEFAPFLEELQHDLQSGRRIPR